YAVALMVGARRDAPLHGCNSRRTVWQWARRPSPYSTRIRAYRAGPRAPTPNSGSAREPARPAPTTCEFARMYGQTVQYSTGHALQPRTLADVRVVDVQDLAV